MVSSVAVVFLVCAACVYAYPYGGAKGGPPVVPTQTEYYPTEDSGPSLHDKFKDFYDKATDKAKEVWSDTKDSVESAKDKVKEFVTDTKDKAKEVFHRAKGKTEEFVDNAKGKATELYKKGMEHVKDMVENITRKVKEEESKVREESWKDQIPYDVPKDLGNIPQVEGTYKIETRVEDTDDKKWEEVPTRDLKPDEDSWKDKDSDLQKEKVGIDSWVQEDIGKVIPGVEDKKIEEKGKESWEDKPIIVDKPLIPETPVGEESWKDEPVPGTIDDKGIGEDKSIPDVIKEKPVVGGGKELPGVGEDKSEEGEKEIIPGGRPIDSDGPFGGPEDQPVGGGGGGYGPFGGPRNKPVGGGGGHGPFGGPENRPVGGGGGYGPFGGPENRPVGGGGGYGPFGGPRNKPVGGGGGHGPFGGPENRPVGGGGGYGPFGGPRNKPVGGGGGYGPHGGPSNRPVGGGGNGPFGGPDNRPVGGGGYGPHGGPSNQPVGGGGGHGSVPGGDFKPIVIPSDDKSSEEDDNVQITVDQVPILPWTEDDSMSWVQKTYSGYGSPEKEVDDGKRKYPW